MAELQRCLGTCTDALIWGKYLVIAFDRRVPYTSVRQIDYAGQAYSRAALLKALVGPSLVVVDQELLDHRLQVASAEDQQVVQHLPATGAHEPLLDRLLSQPSSHCQRATGSSATI